MIKQQKGITLIALVVTIVVLLILAAVSINLVMGENGALNRAEKATEATRVAEIKDEMEMYRASQKIDAYTKNNDSTTLEDYLISQGVVKAEEIIDGKITIGETVIELEEGEGSGSTGNTGATLLSQITAANYGDKVNYTANGVSDWEIFYKDETNVYIIASDYLAHGGDGNTTKIPAGAGMTNSGTYVARWSPAPSIATITNHIAKFSPVTSETKAWSGNYSTNNNGRCVSTLLDTNLWSAYANGTGGEKAIGSPTLNMFVASWNEKYPSDKIYCNTVNETGYFFETSSTLALGTYYADLSGKEGYDEELYYPHQSDVNDCSGYWLASPSAYSSDVVMLVYGPRPCLRQHL